MSCKSKYFIRVFIPGILLLLMACVKDAEFKYEADGFPVLETTFPTDINEDGATFHCKIHKRGKGNYQVDNIIFSWKCPSCPTGSILFHDTVVVNHEEGEDVSLRMEWSLLEGKSYVVTSYTQAGEYTIDGGEKVFNSIGSKPYPVVGIIDPTRGYMGTKVSLYGMNFGNNSSELKVTFDGNECAIDYISPYYVRIIIPPSNGPVTAEIILERNGYVSKYNKKFYYRYVPGN